MYFSISKVNTGQQAAPERTKERIGPERALQLVSELIDKDRS